jgi:hypothetical protein
VLSLPLQSNQITAKGFGKLLSNVIIIVYLQRSFQAVQLNLVPPELFRSRTQGNVSVGHAQTPPDVRNTRRRSGRAGASRTLRWSQNEYTCGRLRMYVQRSPAEIQAPRHWNLIGRNMTAPPPVMLSPSSALLPSFPSLYFS